MRGVEDAIAQRFGQGGVRFGNGAEWARADGVAGLVANAGPEHVAAESGKGGGFLAGVAVAAENAGA